MSMTILGEDLYNPNEGYNYKMSIEQNDMPAKLYANMFGIFRWLESFFDEH